MNILKDLEPNDVFKYFEEISQIPRGSGNEKAISDYLKSFGESLGLETIQDKALNIIIKKPATKGYENAPTVILQGHMDMVCEKNVDTVHDFTKDPLELRIDGDFVYANGTTLGADNGIAVAYGMAILASKDIEHPSLELLVTTDEETGMTGAMALNGEDLSGKILLNLDSEEEGFFLVSCAGGVRTNVSLDIKWEDTKENVKALEISLRNLKGGHSGMEINKGRGNSNKLMGRVLNDLLDNVDFSLAYVNGGSKDNAIPRECDALIVVEEKEIEKVKFICEEFNKIFKNELGTSDKDVTVKALETLEIPTEVFSKDSTYKAIKILNLIPSRVDSMSMEIEDLVQSSTNLGVVETNNTSIIFRNATRSSVGTLKEKIVKETSDVAEVLGGKCEVAAPYPEWQYNPESKIRELCKKVYKDVTGEDAKIIAIHAGLECGLLGEKIAGLDMISFGPNMFDVHTPNEHLSISSTMNVWKLLLEILKEIK
ncbi:MAG: aminoacyl-histidine dipeptidase [Clostridium perfringens]|nr:aminoacyl-histidine dipeptidase [Clostridium perfringens]